MKHFSLPFVMGAAMGLMMLRMLHSAVLNEGGPAGLALVVFIGAHVLLGLVALAVTIFAARISQKARKFLARLHRLILVQDQAQYLKQLLFYSPESYLLLIYVLIYISTKISLYKSRFKPKLIK